MRRMSILLVIFAFGAFAFFFLEETIITAVSPIWKAENAISRSFRNSADFFKSKQELISENTILKEQLASLSLELESMSGSRVEESVLLELVGRKSDSNMKLAAVLTHPPQTPYDTLIIDAGSRDSISVGSEVYLPEGPALGFVSEVFSKQARVKLFSTNQVETSALLERNSVPIVLKGVGAGNFKFSIPRDIEVEKGDRVITSGIASRLIGIVEEINIQPTDSFKEVLARSPANIFTIRFVFVSP